MILNFLWEGVNNFNWVLPLPLATGSYPLLELLEKVAEVRGMLNKIVTMS